MKKNHVCPSCGHRYYAPDAHQKKAGRARWKGTRKRDRSAAARAAALKRWHPAHPLAVATAAVST